MGVHGLDLLLGLSPLYMGVMMLTPAYDTPGDKSATKTERYLAPFAVARRQLRCCTPTSW